VPEESIIARTPAHDHWSSDHVGTFVLTRARHRSRWHDRAIRDATRCADIDRATQNLRVPSSTRSSSGSTRCSNRSTRSCTSTSSTACDSSGGSGRS